jgi:hypothetical protein
MSLLGRDPGLSKKMLGGAGGLRYKVRMLGHHRQLILCDRLLLPHLWDGVGCGGDGDLGLIASNSLSHFKSAKPFAYGGPSKSWHQYPDPTEALPSG